MAPFDTTALGSVWDFVVHLILGLAFGFVLERAGFGDSRKLAAQFQLTDMSVLKVMFTGIITAALLLFWAVALGVLDFERLWVNPTFLGSGIVGGLVFGVGFVVGGYCPGTACVAAATLKLDGLFFVLGVMGGILVFGYTVPWVDAFWQASGALGRLTLPEAFALEPAWVVLGAVLLALTMFAGGEWVERWMSPDRVHVAGPRWLAALALAAAAALVVAWAPTESLRSAARGARARQAVVQRLVHVSPEELATLLVDRRTPLRVYDLRDEAAFNRFHLADAERVEPGSLRAVALAPSGAVKLLIGARAEDAERAFVELGTQGVGGVYILDGGVERWLAFSRTHGVGLDDAGAALGGRHAASRAPSLHGAQLAFTARVKLPGAGARKGGGCGG